MFRPYVITLSRESSDSLLPDFESFGIKVTSLGLSRFEGLLFAQHKLNQLVVEISPDLIHSQGARADVFSSKLSCHYIPRICTVRNFPQIDYQMTYGKIMGMYLTFTQIRAFRRLNLCCCVSDAVSDNLRDKFGITNSRTVYNGVDDAYFTKVESSEKNIIRTKLGIPLTSTVWLSSMGKDLRKNSDYIVKEFIPYLKKNKKNMLVFIGDGMLRDTCEKLAKDYQDQIRFCGRTSDVRSYLHASDYFVSASKAEGMPNAVLEAMACGMPVILSDIPPHIEIKKISSGSTFLFSPEETNSLLNTLMSIDIDNYYRESAVSLQAVKDRLSSVTMSQTYQIIYKDLLGVKDGKPAF